LPPPDFPLFEEEEEDDDDEVEDFDFQSLFSHPLEVHLLYVASPTL